MSVRKRNNRLGIIAVIAIIILLLLNSYLLYNNFNQKKVIKQQQEKVDVSNKLKLKLEKEYYNALASLEELRGDNDELNEMIEEQKELLKTQKNRISALIEENKNLDYVRQQIKEMEKEAAEYLAEIKSLKQRNKELTMTNAELQAAKTELRMKMNSERLRNDSLAALNQSVRAAKNQVVEKNKSLNKTVQKAAAIDVINIDVKSYKITRNGNLRRRRRAKNIELVEVCFETTVNPIAESGTESFYVRIINPNGETMANKNRGSGVFTEMEDDTELRYTKLTQMRYNKTPSVACIQWSPDVEFIEGIYEVEIYNKGYLVGKTTIELK